MQIQYLGFEPKARSREYSYRVLGPRSETREFTLSILNQAFLEKRLPYQDAADFCYRSLQRALSEETSEQPLARHWTVSNQDLDEYQQKHRPARRRS